MKKNILKSIVIILTAVFIVLGTAYAQSVKSSSSTNRHSFAEAKQLAYSDSLRLTELFKDLHQHPELGFKETRTSVIVAKELKALGYEVMSGIGKTGVVGILRNGNGLTVMYRADMDCLPIKETTGLTYASTDIAKKEDGTEVPLMHACGHDAHVTWLLGIAKIMVTMKGQWKGTLVFVAQPAEEVVLGADAMANEMYAKGVPSPDYLLGMHTWPLPVGYISNCAGARMAGSDQLDVTFHGIGGHGSSPHLTKDPVVMAATAIIDYQSIVSRSVSAQNPHVITVGSVQAGTANNIIPGSALLKINLRWFNDADRSAMINGINKVDSSIAFANGLPKELYPTVVMKGMVYPLKNDTGMVNKVNGGLANILPQDQNITNMAAVMVSEDFPRLIPGNKKPVYDYLLVGIADPKLSAKAQQEGKQFPFYNHNSNFTVALSAIPFGTAIGASALLEMFR